MHWRTVPKCSNKHIFTLPVIQQLQDIYRCFFHFPGELPLSQPLPHLFCCHQHLPGPCFLQNKLESCHGQDLSNRVPTLPLGGFPPWGQFPIPPPHSLHLIFDSSIPGRGTVPPTSEHFHDALPAALSSPGLKALFSSLWRLHTKNRGGKITKKSVLQTHSISRCVFGGVWESTGRQNNSALYSPCTARHQSDFESNPIISSPESKQRGREVFP